MMPNICYNCGIALTPEIATCEHIPAKNLYVGVPDFQKQNLITVPACYACNQKYSKIDSEIRDMIGISNDSLIEKQDLTGKAVRGILREKSFLERLHFDVKGQVIGVNFNQKIAVDIHTKNFKGLFLKEYETRIPEDFEINILADGGTDGEIRLANVLYPFLVHDKPQWKFSGHPDLFKYLITGFAPDVAKKQVVKSNNIAECIGITAVLVYHNVVGAVVYCGRKDYIETIKKERGI